MKDMALFEKFVAKQQDLAYKSKPLYEKFLKSEVEPVREYAEASYLKHYALVRELLLQPICFSDTGDEQDIADWCEAEDIAKGAMETMMTLYQKYPELRGSFNEVKQVFKSLAQYRRFDLYKEVK